MSCDDDDDVIATSTPKRRKMKLEHPSYTVYADTEILAGSKSNNISNEARNRLIRGTIHNMTSLAASHPFCRLPTAFELEEMAKSIVVMYPCLKDADTGHVSIAAVHFCSLQQ